MNCAEFYFNLGTVLQSRRSYSLSAEPHDLEIIPLLKCFVQNF